MSSIGKANLLAALQMDILRLQGFKSVNSSTVDAGLGPITEAFPNATFPLGALHEFLLSTIEDVAATSGFIAGLLSSLIKHHGAVLWISTGRRLFPPALATFRIRPDRCIFVDVNTEKDLSWAIDEALKCQGIRAVVCELQDLSFPFSRRLQLAAEQSQVTALLLRKNRQKLNTTACVSRWKVSSLPSESIPVELMDDLPGIGYPKWKVELLRVRNGKPGSWDVMWMNGKFHYLQKVFSPSEQHNRIKKAG